MRRQSLLLIMMVLLGSPTLWSAQNPPTEVAAEALTLNVADIASQAPETPPGSNPAVAVALPAGSHGISQRCAAGIESGPACSFKWRPALFQSVRFLAIQHALNTPTYRGTLKGPFFRDWLRSVKAYRYTRWNDNDPFLVNYIGHPMMGAVTGRIQIQNDPRGISLEFGKSKAYWKSRAKAMGFSSVYAAQWELGPVSETSIGNLGSFSYYSESSGRVTNGTGAVDLVVTPVAGTAWLIGEDIIDKYAIRRLERVSNKKLWLLGISVLNPTRSVGNMLRMKTPWHRDTRAVGSKR